MKSYQTFFIVPALFFSCLCSLQIEAAFTIDRGRLVHIDEVATLPPDQHFDLGMAAIDTGNWEEAAKQFYIVSHCYPTTSYGQEALYYLGVSNFKLAEFDLANDSFTQYLKVQNNPKFFLDTIKYKYVIAEKLKLGAKRRILGTKQLPKWATGKTLALKIYDEVISAMPCHELAAKALYSKGCLLRELRDYRESIESFQLIIKRFPKNELTPECYLLITKVYLEQSLYEFQNPDLLALAEINLRKFKQEFPREERIIEAENGVYEIKEIYAKGLYDTGQFYERIEHPRASLIYYHNAINQFPDTSIAELCKKRLRCLDPNFEENASVEIKENESLLQNS